MKRTFRTDLKLSVGNADRMGSESMFAMHAGSIPQRCVASGTEKGIMENISEEDQETIREFLVESDENLSRLDQDLVELEKHPRDGALLGSVFRTIHTIKGACGFLVFSTLEGITHQAESLLSQLRDGKRDLTPALVSLILETVDATRKVLASIEATGKEGTVSFEDLTERLRAAAQLPVGVEKPVTPAPSAPNHPLAPTQVPNPAPKAVSPADKEASAPLVSAKPEKSGENGQIRKGEEAWDRTERRKETGRREDDPERHSAAVDANIRVGVGLLDKLMDLVGELVLTRNQILQYNNEREDATLNTTSQRLNLITTELQEGVMKTRMQPIGVVWNKMPRVVRDMSIALGKEIQLEMVGAETELDRTIIEAIKDPLMHIIRNSCDHGIELPDVRVCAGKPTQGTLTLRAFHEGGQVNIEIGDDGGGIDVDRVKQIAIEKGILRPEQADKLSEREALSLIFQPGFSTAQVVTNISGRGVGMDVVKSHIEKIGGVVDILSRPSEGTTVKIRIPLTLAIIPGLVVTSGGECFVIPQVSLLELIRLDGDSSGKHIEYVHGTPVYRRRGTLLPIAYLNQVLGLKSADQSVAVNMVVLQAEDQLFGLVVEGINDTQEIVVKPLGKQLKGLTLYAGATIMGDGRVALILDVLGIAQSSGVFGHSHEPARTEEKQKMQAEIDRQRLLLFKSGSFERLAVPLSLVARLEEIPQSAIERAGGGMVIQYRDRILSLVSLRDVLEPGVYDHAQLSDLAQVVVIKDGNHSIGMVVDEIVDIAEEAVTIRQKSTRKGLLGSAVVAKRITDFLDLNQVIDAAKDSWYQSAENSVDAKRVLIVDASAFSRSMIRSGLDMAGFVIYEATNADEAMQCMDLQSIDVVLAALDLPDDCCSALLDSARSRPDREGIPVIALAGSREGMRARECLTAGFKDCQMSFDSAAILESVTKLVSESESEKEELECVGEKR
jgi:two-component system chemotaxis sensor kinase CheA